MTVLPPAAPPPWLPVAGRVRPQGRWPMFVALVVALIALCIAIAAWLRPAPENKPAAAPTYTDQQVADAKAAMCSAYQKVQQALDIAGARESNDDPTWTLAKATGIRQAFDFGSRYLLTELAEEPATPLDLANTVRKLASSYRDTTLALLDGLTISDQALTPTLSTGDNATLTVQGLCK